MIDLAALQRIQWAWRTSTRRFTARWASRPILRTRWRSARFMRLKTGKANRSSICLPDRSEYVLQTQLDHAGISRLCDFAECRSAEVRAHISVAPKKGRIRQVIKL